MSVSYRYPTQKLTQLPRPGVNRAYRAWIRSQCCIVSGVTWNIEAAHTGPHVLGRKANDLTCIPLTRKLHLAQFKNSYHALGRVKFEECWEIDIESEISRLQQRALACGISLEPTVKRKGLGRAGLRKRDSAEGAA